MTRFKLLTAAELAALPPDNSLAGLLHECFDAINVYCPEYVHGERTRNLLKRIRLHEKQQREAMEGHRPNRTTRRTR